ncbi:MAG: hypothetical protein EZS28_051399, partial [Streblomastix strix]
GNGGAIYAQIKSGTSGGLSITGTTKTTFTSCQALPTDSGLGGAIYLDLASGTETKFDLTGASYSTGNNALYGKSLFINAQGDLQVAVPLNQGSKIGAGLDSYEYANLDNLMGYDNFDEIQSDEISLYFAYSLPLDVCHIKYPFLDEQGDDNRFCGHFYQPCLTLDYALLQNGAVPEEKKVGIINFYVLNSLIAIDLIEGQVKIQNSLNNQGETTNIQSELLIEEDGKFSIISGSLLFDKITFKINANAQEGYLLTASSESIEIEISNCFIRMASDTTGYSISTGLAQLNGGQLTISNLD